VASLAQLAHSSRSQFAEQFRVAVGDSPLRYLTSVWMRHAMNLLEDARSPAGPFDLRVRLGAGQLSVSNGSHMRCE
jgi:AraC-like DNA-binding protein